MKTTLIVDDTVMRRLKERAARERTTISSLVEAALRSFLDRPTEPHTLEPLPTFRGGRALVDVSNREALHEAMEAAGAEEPDR